MKGWISRDQLQEQGYIQIGYWAVPMPETRDRRRWSLEFDKGKFEQVRDPGFEERREDIMAAAGQATDVVRELGQDCEALGGLKAVLINDLDVLDFAKTRGAWH